MKTVDNKSIMKKIFTTFTLGCMLTAMMTLTGASPAHAYDQNHYASRSALADGSWVKIKVTDEGIYRLSYDKLRELGFSDPSRVRVYGWGGNAMYPCAFTPDLGDDLNPAASLHENDALFFYGEGDRRVIATSLDTVKRYLNEYHAAGYYFLSDREYTTSPRVHDVLNSAGRTPLKTHLKSIWFEDEVQNVSKGGVFYHGRVMKPGENESFTFDITDYCNDPSTTNYLSLSAMYGYKNPRETTRVTIEMPSGFSAVSTNNPTKSKFDSEVCFYALGYINNTYRYNGQIPDGPYTFTLTNVSTSNQVYFAFDYVRFNYVQNSRMPADHSPKVFQFVKPTAKNDFVIGGATPNTRVFNVTSAFAPAVHNTVFDSATSELRGSFDRKYDGQCRLVAFDPEYVTMTPEIVGKVENQNLHATPTPQMAIITTATMYDKAQELADVHRRHGLDVQVFLQEQVFNEFSSGTPHPAGYRMLAKMFYDRDPKRFKYLLLYGTGVWDNRCISLPEGDRLLTYQCADNDYALTTSSSYTHDGFFGMLEDDFDHATIARQRHSIAVGRLPVEDMAHADMVNKKIASYMDNPPTVEAYANVMAMSDDGNANTHLNHSLAMIETVKEGAPAVTFHQAHNLLYEWENNDAKILRSIATAALKQGAGLFTYSGHGEPNGFAPENLWTRTIARNTSYDVPPLAILATCTAYEFDRPDTDVGIGEVMVYQPDGGAIGVIGACRPVYMEYNQLVNIHAAHAYGQARTGTTIGDIYLEAQRGILSTANLSLDAAANTLCYNLCGDPAVPIAAPTYDVNITTLNQKPVPAIPDDGVQADTLAIKPLASSRLEGFIVDTNGKRITDFNGTARLTIYESPRTMTTIIQNVADQYTPTLPVEVDQDILSTAVGEVTDGKFVIDFMPAIPIFAGDHNRLVITATSADGLKSALGMTPMVRIENQNSEPEAVGDGPAITEMYLDTPSFNPGDPLGNDVVLHATVTTDNAGLKTGSAIGSAPRVCLDGTTFFNNLDNHMTTSPDDLSKWNLTLPVNGLTPGHHTLTFTVHDNTSRSASASINFNVVDNKTDATLAVIEDGDRSHLVLDIDAGDKPVYAPRLIIEDALGNNVITLSNISFPYTWNLKDAAGQQVKDGHYSAYVIAGDNTVRLATKRVPLVVIK